MKLDSGSYYFHVGQITKPEICFQCPNPLRFCLSFSAESYFYFSKPKHPPAFSPSKSTLEKRAEICSHYTKKSDKDKVCFLRDICILTQTKL